MKILFDEKFTERLALPHTDLECEQAIRLQMRRRLLDQIANQFVAARAAEERNRRIVQNFARK